MSPIPRKPPTDNHREILAGLVEHHVLDLADLVAIGVDHWSSQRLLDAHCLTGLGGGLRLLRLGGSLRLLVLTRGCGNLLLRLLRELQVLLQHRQALPGEGGQIGILSLVDILLELVDILLMIAHHLVRVGVIELLAGLLLQLGIFLLVLVRQLWRQLHALFLGDLLQLVVGLAMVVDHALAELLDFVACCLLLRELAELDFLEAALRSLGRELDVFLRQLLCRRRCWLLLCGGLILREGRLNHQTDQRGAREQVFAASCPSSS